MNGQPASSPGGGGQWAHGNQNVQVHGLAQGASVHVTFAGQRRRVPLRPAVVPVGAKVRSPARLMRASSGVLPFVEREGLLAGLQAWMAGPSPFSTYLVGGRGGSGKTRLGVHLCLAAQQQGWVCGLLEERAEQGGVEALAEVPTARLVVVDYAETRAEQLAALLPALANGASIEHPVRVLLLVRAGPREDDWSAALRGRGDWLDAVLDDTDQQVLDNQLLTAHQRAELFTATATAFARREQPDLAADTPPPTAPALEGPAFATPLMVVGAAYLSVHDGQQPPTTGQGLLAELTDHEDRYWRATASAANLDLDPTLRAAIVALATLAGADSQAEARDLLTLLPDLDDAPAERRGRLARWAHDLYPGPRWWNPLEPDLLGEHLVATHLTEHPRVLAGALQRDEPAALTQPLGLYARAASGQPGFAAVLSPVLTDALGGLSRTATTQAATYNDLPALLDTTTVATALQRAVSVIPVDLADLAAAVDALPPRLDLILNPLALALTRQLATAYEGLAATEPAVYEARLATSLNDLSNRLSDLGRHAEALSAIKHAVSIRQRLAKINPAAHETGLAISLNNLSGCLSQARRHTEALSTIEQAVSIYRPLAETNPDAHKPNLAGSLNNFSLRLNNLGRRLEALSAIEEAVSIYRRLAETNPAAYQPDLAMALHNFSDRLGDLGRHPEALSAIEEAVSIYRRLAAMEPAAYQPDLAGSLNNLANRLSDLGRHLEAQMAMEEANKLRTRE